MILIRSSSHVEFPCAYIKRSMYFSRIVSLNAAAATNIYYWGIDLFVRSSPTGHQNIPKKIPLKKTKKPKNKPLGFILNVACCCCNLISLHGSRKLQEERHKRCCNDSDMTLEPQLEPPTPQPPRPTFQTNSPVLGIVSLPPRKLKVPYEALATSRGSVLK